MGNLYTAKKQTLGDLLTGRTSSPLRVPDFQRSFSWDTSPIRAFWDDVKSFSEKYAGENVANQEYFLGPMVLTVKGDKREVLDGQQRLATATIMLASIRDVLHKEFSDTGAAGRTQSRYIADYNDYLGRVSPYFVLNQYDRVFFQQEIQTYPPIEKSDTMPRYGSHRLIEKARRSINGLIYSELKGMTSERSKKQWVLRFQEVLTNYVSVIVVESEDEDNAATVFETLNDRGIGLSAPDLLRNLLLRRAVGDDCNKVVEDWGLIFELEDGTKVEEFLRHFWVSRCGDVKTRSLYREIKHEILDSDIDSLTFSRQLRDESLTYGNIVNCRDDDPHSVELLREIAMLGAKALLPAVLSCFAKLNLDSRRRVVRALVDLYVRHNLIGDRDNSVVESFVFALAKAIRSGENIGGIRKEIIDFAPGDEEFQVAFKSTHITRARAARYLLWKLEKHIGKHDEFDISGEHNVTLEHIYPKNSDVLLPDHQQNVHLIGNLTLLRRGHNRKLKNSLFDMKKSMYRESKIEITRRLADFKSWDLDSIARRQAEFSEVAPEIWKF